MANRYRVPHLPAAKPGSSIPTSFLAQIAEQGKIKRFYSTEISSGLWEAIMLGLVVISTVYLGFR